MAKWTEVDIYTGLVKKVDEDAPANSVAGGGVALPPDAMMKKKKKRLIDARTKEYRQHRARLEKLRAQRQAKTNNMNEEQISEMKKVEIKLHPRNIDKTIQKIVKHIGIENRGRGTKIKVIQNMSDDSVTLDGGKADVGRQVADIRNFIGFKSAKVIESVGEETLDEAMDKKTAIAILKMKKKQEFYGREGAMIYMSPDERDALKKKVGKLGRGIPGPRNGVSTMDIINTALGSTTGRGDYDTEDNGKIISWKKGGKSIGKPKTVGDAMKLVNIKEETLDEGKMKELAMKIADVYTKMKKDRTMKPFADKFRQDVKKSLDIRKSLEKVLPDYVSGGSITKLMAGYENYGEEVELDEGKYLKYSDLLLQKSRLIDKHGPESKEVQAVNKELAKEKKKLGIREEVELDEDSKRTITGFDKLIKDDGIDKKDYQKARTMYMRGEIGKLRKHIYKLDTEPMEYIMQNISMNDRDMWKKLYPNAKRGEYMSSIAYNHRNMKEGMSFIDKVQEQIDEFGRESLLAENNMDVIKSVVKSKGAKNIKMKDGSLKMDLFTASAIMNVYDKVNPSNKKKIEALANGKKRDLMKLQSMAMKLHKK